MHAFSIAMFVFAFANLLFAMVTTQVSMMAEVGDYRARLILAVIQPFVAVSTVVLVFISKPRPILTFFVAAILLVNIFAVVILARLTTTKAISGDWMTPLIFSIIPTLTLAYALFLLAKGLRADEANSTVDEKPLLASSNGDSEVESRRMAVNSVS
ncbi:MAG: hypothetical protein F4Y63_10890 [Chloroflexi bacterium]|nr:hypothetical protein [Chloroflexota bacterium]MYK61027.1 hypothetical protein [Chloroflexota bacterium]